MYDMIYRTTYYTGDAIIVVFNMEHSEVKKFNLTIERNIGN